MNDIKMSVCFHHLCSYHDNPMEIVSELLSNKWETRPDMDMNWIIKNVPELYYFELSDTCEFIGFMIYGDSTIYYFEILEKYRKHGYSGDIISDMYFTDMNINVIYTDELMKKFWIHILSLNSEDYNYKSGKLVISI